MSRKKHVLLFTVMLSLLPTMLFAADDVSIYLILNDIPPYSRLTTARDIVTDQSKTIPGYTSYPVAGVVAGAGHFIADHSDLTFETTYQNDTLGVVVEVTKHSGSDSDKWLGHEMERDFRNYYGLPGDSFVMRVVDGNTIMAAGSGGWDYRWLSGNNKVIHIEYTDLQMTRPEPLEVVKAYLAKYPSTLSSVASADLRTAGNKTTWIKDEMERRLWLCDKWFMQLQLKKADEKQVYQESVKSLNVFLDYRDKYYGIKAADEKNLLASYLNSNNGTGIKAKLAEYKNWWAVNKGKAISL